MGFSQISISHAFHQVIPIPFTNNPVALARGVIMTVRFSGFEGAEEAGLLYYNPPTV